MGVGMRVTYGQGAEDGKEGKYLLEIREMVAVGVFASFVLIVEVMI
jgi:hypothetical protein